MQFSKSKKNFDRRHFLHTAGGGILAASFFGRFASSPVAQTVTGNYNDTLPAKMPPIDAASEKPRPTLQTPLHPDKRIGFAIVGLGHLSLEQIMPAFGKCNYAKPAALVSGDIAKATKIADQYGIAAKNIYNYQNYDNIKDNAGIDAVYIVLPNSMHAEYTIRAAKAGKHVLCEKPMAVSSAEAQQMIDACKVAGKKLMVAYRIQYEPNNKIAKEFTREKKYGKVKVIEMFNGQNIGDPAQWRLRKALAGGGSLPDIGLYCLNTARYLTGEEPEEVMAGIYTTPGDERFKEVEETVLFQLKFPGGTLVNAGCSYGVHESRRYRCLGDKGGWFEVSPAFSYEGIKMEIAEVKDEKDWKAQPTPPNKNQFALEMDHFAKCILNNKTPYTPGEEGLQDQKIMEAIYTSAKEKKPVALQKITTTDTFRGDEMKEEDS